MSIKMRNCDDGVITIDVKDIPMGSYGLDDVMPPRYFPQVVLLSFDCRPRRVAGHSPINGRGRIHQPQMASRAENLAYLVVSLPFSLLPMRVVILSSSDFTMVCPRSKRVSVATEILVDDVVHSGCDVSVATSISDRARADYTNIWALLAGEVASSIQF